MVEPDERPLELSDLDRFYVYSMYGETGTLLYVGQTIDLRGRLSDHVRETEWWDSVAAIGVQEVFTRDAAIALEAARIERLRPVYNSLDASQSRYMTSPTMFRLLHFVGRARPHS